MSPRLSARDLRVLAGGTATVALLLLGSRGIPAWRRWDAGARANAAARLADEAAARASAGALRVRVDSAEARRARLAELAPALLEGGSAASAAATLTSILTTAAAAGGISLGSIEVLPDTAPGATFSPVVVRVSATGDLEGITRMLQYLENAPELLRFPEVAITQAGPQGGGTAPLLQVEMTVAGLARVSPVADRAAEERPVGQAAESDGVQ